MSVAVGIGFGTRKSCGYIHRPGQRLRSPGELSEVGQVAVAEVKVQSERIVLVKGIAREFGAYVEVGSGVPMNERTIPRREMTAGVLDGGSNGVPVHHSRRGALACRQSGIKIVDFEISGEGDSRKFAARGAGKIRPAVNRKGQVWRTVCRFQQRRPFLQVVAGE